MVTGSSAI